MKFANLWMRRFQLALHKEMIYRWNFFFSLVATMFIDVFGPIFIIVVYSLSPGLPGWNMYEFILMSGFFTLVMGVWHAFFSGISWLTTELVIHGIFDNILVRPYNTLIYLMTGGIDLEGFGEITVGIIIILFALSNLTTTITVVAVLYMLAILIFALIFTFSMSVFVAALSVKFTQATALLDLFYHTVEFGKYPITIYGITGRFLFTFIIPFGLAAFYPAQALLGFVDITLIAKLAAVSLSILLISILVWKHSLNAYSSAGG